MTRLYSQLSMTLMLPLINWIEILKSFSDWVHQWKIQFKSWQKQTGHTGYLAVIHPTVSFSGSEAALKTEHKHLGMIFGSKLNFQSHLREAIIKARERYRNNVLFIQICITGCFLTKYINCMCDHTWIMVTSFIANMIQNLNLTSSKSWNSPNTQQCSRWLGHRVELIPTDFMKSSVGKSFTT